MSVARRIAAAVVPDALKRRHERWTTDRYLAAVRGPTEEYVRRNGLSVRHGPFAGLEYLPDGQSWSDDLVAKLAGTYEQELQPVVGEWIAAGHAHVVDVGCAEGYYAAGFALAMPGTRVHAFDIEPAARERCAAMAAHNGLGERLTVGAACTPETLAALPPDGVALLADCEGCERALLDPAAVPNLARWAILVELHEFLDPGIADTIAARFEPTHEVTLIDEAPRDGARIPELAFMDAAARRTVLDERRPAQMRWAAMRPRATA